MRIVNLDPETVTILARINSAPRANARQSGRHSTRTASSSPTHPTIDGTATRTPSPPTKLQTPGLS
jgi:hypothetical protein